jgi:hypothetical protein
VRQVPACASAADVAAYNAFTETSLVMTDFEVTAATALNDGCAPGYALDPVQVSWGVGTCHC